MIIARRVFILFFVLGIFCGCFQDKRRVYCIGIDPEWFPIDFKEKGESVVGYVKELLLELSKEIGIHFEEVRVHYDNLFWGIKRKKYDVVISSICLCNFNLAKYDFSDPILQTGPVLVVRKDSPYKNLGEIKKGIIAVQRDRDILIVPRDKDILIKTYITIPLTFSALEKQDIDAALVDNILAIKYIKDGFGRSLKIASAPLTEEGLRFVSMKNGLLIDMLNRALGRLTEEGRLSSLKKKWGLL